MSEYILFYSPGTASMAVHLTLLEIGTPYQPKLVDPTCLAKSSRNGACNGPSPGPKRDSTDATVHFYI